MSGLHTAVQSALAKSSPIERDFCKHDEQLADAAA